MISNMPIAVKTKNHYHKFLKEILNYGSKWHDFNFTSVYNNMENLQILMLYQKRWIIILMMDLKSLSFVKMI